MVQARQTGSSRIAPKSDWIPKRITLLHRPVVPKEQTATDTRNLTLQSSDRLIDPLPANVVLLCQASNRPVRVCLASTNPDISRSYSQMNRSSNLPGFEGSPSIYKLPPNVWLSCASTSFLFRSSSASSPFRGFFFIENLKSSVLFSANPGHSISIKEFVQPLTRHPGQRR